MAFLPVSCFNCEKRIFRSRRRINEAKKFGWKTYCSLECQKGIKNKQKSFRCSRFGCNKTFRRQRNEIKKSKKLYCSRSCAVIVNNSLYPKNPGIRRICKTCGKEFVSLEKYCSRICKDKGSVVSKRLIIQEIKLFYEKKGRIPFKREYNHYHAARARFGTWNKAIKTAGFEPNPVMFAKKYIANDGHKCDSLAEKIIDDWLYARKIDHDTNVPYPGENGMTVDFVVGNLWIEFFGLSGQHKRYDELKEQKFSLMEKFDLNLIKIYPRHLFPRNKLNEVLADLTGRQIN